MMRRLFFLFAVASVAMIGGLGFIWPGVLWAFLVVGPIVLVGLHDVSQTRSSLLRNYPVIGHGRYLLEEVRPEIQQYFVESDTDGTPFNREKRSLIYQRAKHVLQTVPFGTQHDVYSIGFETIGHSMLPRAASEEAPRVTVGGPRCAKPYEAALLNISAMSYGSLSKNAIMALNIGAKRGGFWHNTGEGGLSPHHLEHGGDLVWQIGTGYFGCRTAEGDFDPEAFARRSWQPAVKMIEIKLSQGAKPAHGGILPAAKVTPEIAEIRSVPMGKDVLSPPAHSAFSTPVELLRFVDRLRTLAGGKPVGFKLCVGDRGQFMSVCKAMLDTGITPDFITVDGAEGGTGAAPLEFTNSVGTPLREGLSFVHNTLVGAGLRQHVRIIASGKIASGFDMVRAIALGADMCNSARGMMFALGCIQARRCNSNTCPVGIATTDSSLAAALHVENKARRVANFQHDTVHAACELAGAAGLDHPAQLRPEHVWRRVAHNQLSHFGEIYDQLEDDSLVDGTAPEAWCSMWDRAVAEEFGNAHRLALVA